MRKEEYKRLLKVGINHVADLEGKSASMVEEEIGSVLYLSKASIQRFKAGHLPRDSEALEKLAKEIVKRGCVNSTWARRLFDAAGQHLPKSLEEYPAAYPEVDSKIHENLPAPTFGKFVMREREFTEILSAFKERASTILVIGFPGVGKTSLVHEIACLASKGNIPAISSGVIWNSDKGRGGETDLESVLNEIALTLDYPGILPKKVEDKRHELDKVLRNHSVLIIVDNADSITDQKLFEWVLRIPEPSKCIVTSRHMIPNFSDVAFIMEIKGMEYDCARELIEQKVRRLGNSMKMPNEKVIGQLIMKTGGNPKAIEIILGIMKVRPQPLDNMIESLASINGELFDQLFSDCWNIIDENDKAVIISLLFFPQSGGVSAVEYVSNISGKDLNCSLRHLSELSLIEIHDWDHGLTDLDEARYSLHPLVSVFVQNQLIERKDFVNIFKERWLDWCERLANEIGFCWNDVNRLKLLDPPGERQTILKSIEVAMEEKEYDRVISISRGVRYYFYVRGFWANSPSTNLLWAEAANKSGNLEEEIDALLYHCNIASKQGNLSEVERHLPRLEEINSLTSLKASTLIDYRHVKALYFLGAKKLIEAAKLWSENLAADLSEHAFNANRRWYAVCLLKLGKLNEAKVLFQELVDDAQKSNFARGEVAARIQLANLLFMQKEVDAALETLQNDVIVLAERIQDQRAVADACFLLGRIYKSLNRREEAIAYFNISVDKYERLCVQNCLLETKEELLEIGGHF